MRTGRPKHEKTEETKQQVTRLSTFGVTHENIATVMGLAPKTLIKHYRSELDLGKARANTVVAGKLFELASKGNLGAICFWLKCQANWRETNVLQTQMLDAKGIPMDPPRLGISFEDGAPGRVIKDSDGQVHVDTDEPPKPGLSLLN